MTAEILSIIAVCISGITAICSASIPAILNYCAKKAELKAQKKREAEQAYNAKFEAFYQKHYNIVKGLSNHYECWKNNPKHSSKILEFIIEIKSEFPYSISYWLNEFSNKIRNYKAGDNLDSAYNRCRQIIIESYGARITGETPDYLLSDILKVVLKERFDELQHATSKDLKFYNI